jgi:hypothetical protein
LKRENLKIIRYKDETGSETGTGIGGKNSGSRSAKTIQIHQIRIPNTGGKKTKM